MLYLSSTACLFCTGFVGQEEKQNGPLQCGNHGQAQLEGQSQEAGT